jgi:hypothetical protein
MRMPHRAGEAGEAKEADKDKAAAPKAPAAPKPVHVDLVGIEGRTVALPLPPRTMPD